MSVPEATLDRGGPGLDRYLLERAAEDGAASAVWEPTASLVVPASYRRHAGFNDRCAQFAEQGWPVRVRRSGGGLVPQGPGVLNLSMAWRTATPMGDAMEPVYEGLCGLLQEAMAPYGIQADWQAVSGSFCDGRYNLAVNGRKVAGTAQYWQRLSAQEHVVLAHACLLVQPDLPLLIRQANAFEAALGTGRHYRLETLAALAPLAGPSPRNALGQPLTTARLLRHLSDALRAHAYLC
jgi:lipoate-protein ligase A